MIAIIATFTVKPDRTAEFEAFITALAAEVAARETGIRLYQLCRTREQANVYRMMELYDGQEAFERHASQDHVKAAFGKLKDMLEARPEIQFMDAIA